jgi:hypothetical protein
VAYPTKVAPLPEDKGEEKEEECEEKEKENAKEELIREARRIESDVRGRRHIFGLQVEEKIPYPTLITAEKKPQKVAVDLMEAIKQVKVGLCLSFFFQEPVHIRF